MEYRTGLSASFVNASGGVPWVHVFVSPVPGVCPQFTPGFWAAEELWGLPLVCDQAYPKPRQHVVLMGIGGTLWH